MLKSINRLKKESDFSAVLRQGKRTTCGNIVVAILENSLEYSRVGVIVSKKIGNLAVKRNRIRRIVLSEMAELFQAGRIKDGKDIVIRFIKSPEDLDDSKPLRTELNKCLEKLSLV